MTLVVAWPWRWYGGADEGGCEAEGNEAGWRELCRWQPEITSLGSDVQDLSFKEARRMSNQSRSRIHRRSVPKEECQFAESPLRGGERRASEWKF